MDISRSNIFKEPFYIHTHYPKILLNHINIDEYEQREAKEVANTVLFAKNKNKNTTRHSHTTFTIRFVMLKTNPADQNNTNKT